MSEEQAPVLTVSGTLTEEMFRQNVNNVMTRRWAKLSLVFIGALAALELCVNLPIYWSGLTDGYLSVGGFLGILWSNIKEPPFLYLLIAFLLLYAGLCLWYYPRKFTRSFRARSPEGVAVEYRFYEDRAEILASSRSEQEQVRLDWTDVRKKPRENRWTFTLSLRGKQNYAIYKSLMTPAQQEQVRQLLREK